MHFDAPPSTENNLAQFQGFYYTKKNGVICGLPLGASLMQAMSDISKSNFAPLSPEIFAKKFSRWLTTYAPQGFIAWGGATYWVIGNCKNILTERQDEVGVNVIRLIANTTPSYFWYTKGKSVAQRATDADVIDSENDDPVYHLVYTPWDWLLNGYGDDEMFPLDYEQLETITNNERSSLV